MAPRPKSEAIIVGYGRIGGVLARGARAAGWRVSVEAHRAASVRRARKDRFPRPNAASWAGADVCFLCVPDGAVSEVALAVEPTLGRSVALVHCAGAMTLGVLGDTRRARGSFHPLCAVSSPEDSLEGCTVAIATTHGALERRLQTLARTLGLLPVRVPEGRRSLYHSGAVLAAGGVIALLSSAVEALTAAGLPVDTAERALLGLSQSALRGALERGLRKSLTGPVVRGDTETVARHLAALPPDLARLYRVLALRSIDLARGLSAEKRRALRQIL